MEEPGPELIDYLEICWKRKRLILIPTLFLVLAAAAISFVLPKVWEVSCAILPSKILTQNPQGFYGEAVLFDAKQIASQISESSYNSKIADELKLDLKSIPKFKAVNTKDTNLVLISMRHKDVEKAKLILQALIKFLKAEFDAKAEIEINALDIKIKQRDMEIKVLETDMEQVQKRIESLENDQRQYLKTEKRTESESLAMLLYSTNIQLSLRYHEEMKEMLNTKKNDMNSFKDQKARIDFTRVVKHPSVSPEPVSSTRGTLILATAIISFFIFVFVAFALESFDRKKSLRA
ncbi:MAG: Wzz/FepE/Etk N-terminal domain-containing protein [Candidatus Aminicenantales bacterium]